MQLSLLPIAKNQSDVVSTPEDIARYVVNHFKPSGLCLDPCKGNGVFLRHLPAGSEWCEIREGRDFFAWDRPVDWIVSNPPYSIFSEWLQHSFTVAENIVYVIPINKPFNSIRMMKLVYQFGGIKEILALGHGSMFKIGIGFAIGAVHFKRGYNGPISVTFRNGKPNNTN